MRILRPIVFSQALLMVAGKSEMPEGSAVGAQLVGRHPRRREALFAEQLAHQLDGRRPVATTLDQDLEDLALVVDPRCSNAEENLPVRPYGSTANTTAFILDRT